MGACATKSGDLKVKGEPPLVAEDAATAPPVAQGEKTKQADGVPAAAEADPSDVSRRRSLSDLLREDAEASDGEAVKVVTDEGAAVATGEAEASDGEAGQVAVTDDGAAVATGEAEASDGEAGQVAVKDVSDEGAPVATDEAGAEASDGDAGQVAVKVVTDEDAAVATTEEPEAPAASLSKEEGEESAEAPQVAVEPSAPAVEQDTTEKLKVDDPKSGHGQEPGGEAKAEEEEKRVDPDSVQVAAAPSAEEGSQVAADGAST